MDYRSKHCGDHSLNNLQRSGTVQMPHGMANLTWGGLDYSKLYITAGSTVYILQTKTRGILGYLKK